MHHSEQPSDLREPDGLFLGLPVLYTVSLAAIVFALGFGYRAYSANQLEREHAERLAEHAQHMDELAAAAEPVHPVEAGQAGNASYRCVTKSGWQYTATTAQEAQELCDQLNQEKTRSGGGGIPIFDLQAVKQSIQSGSHPRQAAGGEK